MEPPPVLELRGITKQFPGVLANDHIDFELAKGEVHALLGENGAGKSTLMNVLYGLYKHDAGDILLNGNPVEFGSPKDAIRAGIGMVHQHFMLIPVMTVAENIVLADEPTKAGVFLDYAAAVTRVKRLADNFRFDIDPTMRVDRLTVGQQQRVEILKALYRRADVLILDEPTAVLTPQEALELFRILKELTTEGMSIVFISHKLHEVLEIADRISVLRRGRLVDTVPVEGATEEGLAKLMVGRDVLLDVDKRAAHPGEPLLEVEDVHVRDDRGIEKVRGVSFTVRAGEIVGIAGVDNNGQTELIDAVAGLRLSESGRVIVGGPAHEAPPRSFMTLFWRTVRALALVRAVTNPLDAARLWIHRRLRRPRARTGRVLIDGNDYRTTPRTMTDVAGVGHIPQDRQRRGLILDFSIAENFALHDYRHEPDSHRGLLHPGRLIAAARTLIAEFDVRGGGPSTRAASLSGGNQQKVILAREISRDPRVLLAAQPTRGLDVGAIEFVHRRLVAERDEGRAILLVSLELDEILSLSDRVLVMFEGQIVGEFGPDATEEELGLAMAGHRRTADVA